MLHRLRARTTTRSSVVFLALFALLLGQGLRLCLHAPHAADAGHGHAAAVHVESGFQPSGDVDDQPGDRHVPLGLALVKKLGDGAAFAILTAVALILLMPGPAPWSGAARVIAPPPSTTRGLRPPLRAPPL